MRGLTLGGALALYAEVQYIARECKGVGFSPGTDSDHTELTSSLHSHIRFADVVIEQNADITLDVVELPCVCVLKCNDDFHNQLTNIFWDGLPSLNMLTMVSVAMWETMTALIDDVPSNDVI